MKTKEILKILPAQWKSQSDAQRFTGVNPACPARPVASENGTGVAPADGTGVNPAAPREIDRVTAQAYLTGVWIIVWNNLTKLPAYRFLSLTKPRHPRNLPAIATPVRHRLASGNCRAGCRPALQPSGVRRTGVGRRVRAKNKADLYQYINTRPLFHKWLRPLNYFQFFV